MYRFAEKIIVVTGAASGIGRATALRLHAEGAQIIAVDRDAAGLAMLGIAATPIPIDLTDAQAVLAAMTAIPQIDGLCNAAGGVDGALGMVR